MYIVSIQINIVHEYYVFDFKVSSQALKFVKKINIFCRIFTL